MTKYMNWALRKKRHLWAVFTMMSIMEPTGMTIILIVLIAISFCAVLIMCINCLLGRNTIACRFFDHICPKKIAPSPIWKIANLIATSYFYLIQSGTFRICKPFLLGYTGSQSGSTVSGADSHLHQLPKRSRLPGWAEGVWKEAWPAKVEILPCPKIDTQFVIYSDFIKNWKVTFKCFDFTQTVNLSWFS